MSAPQSYAPNRVFRSHLGNEHLNGAQLFDKDNVAVSQGVTITPAKGGSSNICLVTCQVVDGAGAAIASVFNFDVWLSDDPVAGAGITATTASGAVAAGTPGILLSTYTAKKSFRVQTDATGAFQLSITDTAKTLFVPCAQLPWSGKTIVGLQLTTGNYD